MLGRLMRGRLFGMWIAVALVSACGSAASGDSAAAHPSPTPNPEVARVKAAVTAFITALSKSGETGNASPVEALTLPGSAAQGNAGNFAADAIGSGTGFRTLRVDINQASLTTQVNGRYADVGISWSIYGYPVSYPQDVPTGSAREGTSFHNDLTLEEVNAKWLVASF